MKEANVCASLYQTTKENRFLIEDKESFEGREE
jgi:hypothetical protein